MADDSKTLASLVTEVQYNGWGRMLYPAVYLASAGWHFTLATGWTSTTAGRTVRLPPQADLKRLADLLVPPPPPDTPSPDAVGAALQGAIAGPVSDLLSALTDLGRLPWPRIWEVLDVLGKRGPAMDGQTYLEMLEEQVRSLPNVDQRLPAAMIVELLRRGPRTLVKGQVPTTLERLVQALLSIDDRSQLHVLARLGITPEAAEGTLAMMEAELAASAGTTLASATPGTTAVTDWLSELEKLITGIDINADTFLDFAKPQKQPYGLYIGTAVHEAIGAEYKIDHFAHAAVMTNSSSVSAIFFELETGLAFRDLSLTVALALARPDIFELGNAHGMPPAWVYEIKPAASGGGATLAEYEVLFYADALTLAGIPVEPGPPGVPGTEGVVPIPHGWAAYVSPTPGVIVYRIRKASKQAIEARGQVPANSELKDKVENLLKAAGAATALTGVIAVIIDGLEVAGFTLPLG